MVQFVRFMVHYGAAGEGFCPAKKFPMVQMVQFLGVYGAARRAEKPQ